MSKKLQFKFRAGVDEAGIDAVIKRLVENGALEVRRLFPVEEDEELATLFIADVPDDRQVQRLIRVLSALPAVEFAEPEVKRKLF